MSFGSLEVASIPRTQDYTTMKQNEDNKGAFQQMTLGEHAQKQSEQRTREVHSSDNADWYTGSMMPRKKERMSMPVTVVNTGKKKIPKKMVWW
jgi:hypothetical protein